MLSGKLLSLRKGKHKENSFWRFFKLKIAFWFSLNQLFGDRIDAKFKPGPTIQRFSDF